MWGHERYSSSLEELHKRLFSGHENQSRNGYHCQNRCSWTPTQIIVVFCVSGSKVVLGSLGHTQYYIIHHINIPRIQFTYMETASFRTIVMWSSSCFRDNSYFFEELRKLVVTGAGQGNNLLKEASWERCREIENRWSYYMHTLNKSMYSVSNWESVVSPITDQRPIIISALYMITTAPPP